MAFSALLMTAMREIVQTFGQNVLLVLGVVNLGEFGLI
jgi:hypothetical protein